MLTDPQKRALLALAKRAVTAQVEGAPFTAADAVELPDASGVFVTIKRGGALRGCLGTLENRLGLACEVARCAAESACEDPRFAPVTREELPELTLEISVLGPLERIDPDPGAFTVGQHGLVIEEGAHRGLLLPQVAIEWDWTPEQFLCQTCHKAGLRTDAWQRGATVYRFAADVFGE